MKVIAYLRVSTDQQRSTHLGLDVQRDQIEEYCAEQGWTLHSWHADEALSGSLRYRNRPGLKAAIEALGRGDILITTRRDRLAREAKALGEVELAITDRGAKYVSIAGEGQGACPVAGFMDRAVRDMFGQLEIVFASERTKKALDKKRERNECIGEIPMGYRLAADGLHLEVCPHETHLFDMVLQYHNEGLSCQKIADRLNTAGLRNRYGLTFKQDAVFRYIRDLRTAGRCKVI